MASQPALPILGLGIEPIEPNENFEKSSGVPKATVTVETVRKPILQIRKSVIKPDGKVKNTLAMNKDHVAALNDLKTSCINNGKEFLDGLFRKQCSVVNNVPTMVNNPPLVASQVPLPTPTFTPLPPYQPTELPRGNKKPKPGEIHALSFLERSGVLNKSKVDEAAPYKNKNFGKKLVDETAGPKNFGDRVNFKSKNTFNSANFKNNNGYKKSNTKLVGKNSKNGSSNSVKGENLDLPNDDKKLPPKSGSYKQNIASKPCDPVQLPFGSNATLSRTPSYPQPASLWGPIPPLLGQYQPRTPSSSQPASLLGSIPSGVNVPNAATKNDVNFQSHIRSQVPKHSQTVSVPVMQKQYEPSMAMTAKLLQSKL